MTEVLIRLALDLGAALHEFHRHTYLPDLPED